MNRNEREKLEIAEQVKANAAAHALSLKAAPDDVCACGHARKDHCCAPAGHECNAGWDDGPQCEGCGCEEWRPVTPH